MSFGVVRDDWLALGREGNVKEAAKDKLKIDVLISHLTEYIHYHEGSTTA